MKDFKVGLQLYSLRDCMKDGVEDTLKAVKEMGYDYVELAGYYGMEACQLKEILDKCGLKAISVHENAEHMIENPEKMIADLKTLGAKYYTIAAIWGDGHKGSKNYDKSVADLKKVKNILDKNGMVLLYHNHSHEFARYEGKFKLEWLLEDVGGIYPELDVCWVHYAGYKPEEYMLKYKGKLPILHLKDFACINMPAGPIYTAEQTDEPKYPDHEKVGLELRPIGYGIQDIPAILKAAEETETEYIIVEQDNFTGIEPLEAVKKSREFLRKLGI